MFSSILNKNPLKCRIIIRLDDIAPNMNWDMMKRTKDLFKKYNVKPLIGVIPKNEDKELKSYPKCHFNFWNEIKNLQDDGWEVAIHGYQHIYSSNCKGDYLGLGGNTEFAGYSYEEQFRRLTLGLDIFRERKIKVKTFFAPNHTFDKNTIKACKKLGINSIIDGYGIAPYYENGVLFFPQLFYRLYVMPFGFQVLQIHLNYFTEKDFLNFEQFIKKNKKKIITFSEANYITSNSFFHKTTKYFIEKTLKFKRAFL